ncbi:Tat pathway signal protein [Streptomyces sp. NPDC059851]|uniref:Tat pathway signal protein n=1 Tax=Streptomyces sp. NPDC059851 TaxID=3346971 RepID=UPI0036570D86
MIRSLNRARRRTGFVAPLLTAVLLGAAAPAVVPAGQAQAASAAGGRVCLFRDAEGARGAGHVAWAVRDPKNTRHWIWGATENAEGDSYTEAGKPNGSWIAGGTWEALRKSLKPDGGQKKGFYDAYRCANTSGGDLRAAQRTYENMKNNGYHVTHNNCLTKAVAIFRKYSPALSSAHLPDGGATPPNRYFGAVLNDARGWEKAHAYTPAANRK